jgi:hypothetical protein
MNGIGGHVKPRVFIGSSSEGLRVAYALQSNLEADAEVTVWSQDVFRLGDHVLASLLSKVDASDFGVFVFSADDVVQIRNTEQATVRDNVIFELGLFVGTLGPRRSFVVMPHSANIRIPSDLWGINVATFDAQRGDRDLEAALGPASSRIRKALDEPPDRPLEPELRLPVLARKETLSQNLLAILAAIENSGECSRAWLMQRFPQYGDDGLHYRLEKLRLLSLVSVDLKNAVRDPGQALYRPHPSYREARKTLRPPMYHGSQVVSSVPIKRK